MDHSTDTEPRPGVQDFYRPRYHFTPERGWLNDPNGLVYLDGEYHVFYQHNPLENKWGNISWGHAVSRDLLRWEHLPVAIPVTDGVMAFSGSAVVDFGNTGGFGEDGKPPLVALFTGDYNYQQDQRVAYSNDRGRTWTLYAGNPVLEIGSHRDFRDPKVFWHAGSAKWVMAVVLSNLHKVCFYGSADLKNWEHLSDFGPAGSVGGVWEVPELLELSLEDSPGETRWMLKVDVGEGGPWGGSGAQYFTGHFDGTRFVPDEEDLSVPRWVDHGKDFYAALSFANLPGTQKGPMWLAWMSNWQYAHHAPTQPWRGSLTVPRTLSLRRGGSRTDLVQTPIQELEALRGRHFSLTDTVVEGVRALEFGGATLEIQVRFEPQTALEFGLKLRVGKGQETLVGYDALRQELYVDRQNAGQADFNPQFAGRHGAALNAGKDSIDLHIFLDRSSVEVFADGGRVVLTDLIFPDPQSAGLELFSEGGAVRVEALDVWSLEGES